MNKCEESKQQWNKPNNTETEEQKKNTGVKIIIQNVHWFTATPAKRTKTLHVLFVKNTALSLCFVDFCLDVMVWTVAIFFSHWCSIQLLNHKQKFAIFQYCILNIVKFLYIPHKKTTKTIHCFPVNHLKTLLTNLKFSAKLKRIRNLWEWIHLTDYKL